MCETCSEDSKPVSLDELTHEYITASVEKARHNRNRARWFMERDPEAYEQVGRMMGNWAYSEMEEPTGQPFCPEEEFWWEVQMKEGKIMSPE